MKGINGTRTKKVKVEENEFFTGADTEAGTPCAGVEGIEAEQIEEQPVAFAMYILSPNNCVINFA